MLRRLFFLIPDTDHAQMVVDGLIANGVPRRRIHATGHGVDLGSLPQATERQKKDTAFRLEWFIWNTNLTLFFIALIVFIASLVLGSVFSATVSLVVMLLTFLAGEQFAVKVPDVHLTEFTDALAHGEILLMVDVPVKRVAEVEAYVHSRHPEAATGGVSWTIGALEI
ncbi:MAG: hypothetical protein JSW45_03675 [Thiotrichales bacterium]|nr:MAG: hypothetical protein JSW45_03675 [Thiotrichales bacterium]